MGDYSACENAPPPPPASTDDAAAGTGKGTPTTDDTAATTDDAAATAGKGAPNQSSAGRGFRVAAGSSEGSSCTDQYGNSCDPNRRRLLFGGVQSSCEVFMCALGPPPSYLEIPKV